MTEAYESAAKKLKCAYTGAPMTIDFYFCAGRKTGFYLKGGFDPTQLFLTEADAMRQLTQRPNGRTVKTLVCPYTAKPLELFDAGNGWKVRYVNKHIGGVYGPEKLFQRKEDLIYAASMRGGRTALEPPEPVPHVRVSDGGGFGGVAHSNPTHGLGVDVEKVKESLEKIL